ncbi:hypothetical protein ACFVY9_02960 [Streptomyces sp. NPDC059544]|uniref:hypothetical protein n=1 Tax=Streptomyces sp. NPDC059544 TaxID=3346861 RepID=UPI0036B91A96
MRVRLSDGTHEIEVDTGRAGDTALPEIEATLGRLLDRLRGTPEQPDREQPFGFTGRDLDGVALDSSTERAEPYDDGRDQDDETEDEQ